MFFEHFHNSFLPFSSVFRFSSFSKLLLLLLLPLPYYTVCMCTFSNASPQSVAIFPLMLSTICVSR